MNLACQKGDEGDLIDHPKEATEWLLGWRDAWKCLGLKIGFWLYRLGPNQEMDGSKHVQEARQRPGCCFGY